MNEDNTIDTEAVEVELQPSAMVIEEHEIDKRLKTRRPKKDTIRAKILQLYSKGVKVADISKVVNVPDSTVRDVLNKFKPFLNELGNIEEFRDNKAELLAAGQLAALKSAFTGGKLRKASFLSTLRGYEILNKSERLENGESTENHAHLGKFQITHGEK